MLDRSAFIRPIAHRGLHDGASRCIENSASAFVAASAAGFGIECDLQPAADGTPFVFHDATLERLTAEMGAVADRAPHDLGRMVLTGSADRILRFSDLLDLVGGRVPLLVEIKSDWTPVRPDFIAKIIASAGAYRGPVALMSFDPAVMTAVRALDPSLPRGLIAGIYQPPGWWRDRIDEKRAHALSHLLESGPVAPDFFAYHVADLPTPVTRYVREVASLPLFAWTVRSEIDRATAAAWADAAIFEGFRP